MTSPLRVGIIGAGANTRSRHIPGLRAQPGVEIVAVSNRRAESTAAAVREFGIARGHASWQELIADPEIDAVMIGTWPYLHAPITIAALEAGKHVLTEARLAMNAAEARSMLAASLAHPKLVCQVVPSPFGLNGEQVVQNLLKEDFLGELREVEITSRNGALSDPSSPLAWRQDAALSGFNMLTLGIVHETAMRWVPPPVRVQAQLHAFISTRVDPESGVRRRVGTPDSVQVIAELENGARATYQFSGVCPVGGSMAIRLYGTDGALHYDLEADRLSGIRTADVKSGSKEWKPIALPSDPSRGWRVEADWINSIRTGAPVRFTDFGTGVAYMEFTEAVARSAERGEAVALPLSDLK